MTKRAVGTKEGGLRVSEWEHRETSWRRGHIRWFWKDREVRQGRLSEIGTFYSTNVYCAGLMSMTEIALPPGAYSPEERQ